MAKTITTSVEKGKEGKKTIKEAKTNMEVIHNGGWKDFDIKKPLPEYKQQYEPLISPKYSDYIPDKPK